MLLQSILNYSTKWNNTILDHNPNLRQYQQSNNKIKALIQIQDMKIKL